MGFAVHVRSVGQKYGPTCHQRDRADVTEFVTLVRLSSLGQHVGVLALAGYKRWKSALTAGPIPTKIAVKVGHAKVTSWCNDFFSLSKPFWWGPSLGNFRTASLGLLSLKAQG